MFSFLKRPSLRKIAIVEGIDVAAPSTIQSLLRELPELLLACVVEVPSGKILASYTTHADYNPNQISLRYAKLLHTVHEAVVTGAWCGGPLTDLTLVLDDQLHHLRPLRAGQWYCFVAVHTADANLALVKEVVRRCTTP